MEVYEASFSGLIRIILTIILVSVVIRLIVRLATPVVVRKSQEAMMEEMRRRSEARARQNRPERKEGEVTVEAPGTKKSGDVGGEYVDFKEI